MPPVSHDSASPKEPRWGPRTLAVHAGVKADPITGAVGPSIQTAVTFASRYGDIGFSAAGTVEGKVPFAYAREGHPNAQQLERRLTALEGGADAVVFASGMGAISGLLLMLLNPGDHLVVSDITYAGTAEFVRGFLRQKGVEVTPADMTDLADVRAAITPRTKVIYAESPCNPVLKIVDIAALAEIARASHASLVIDSTFASPALCQPLQLGADFVVHSLTKYCCGHGDAVGGAVIGRDASQMRHLRNEIGTHLGAMLSPFNAWLILRGLETLAIRMEAYSKSALVVARFLESQSAVASVRYPGLPSHPQYELARRQMSLPSGMIAFTVRDMHRFGQALESHLKVFLFAASLGLSRSLILHCDTADLQRTTFQLHAEHLRRYREFAGDGFFRLSIGLEDPQDLCRDLDGALRASHA
jgi:cystathionine beta-lyase/cystathionine gamma-synthase